MLNLYFDLLKLTQTNEAFYFVDHSFNGRVYRVFSYRLASYSDFLLPGALECRGHTFLMPYDWRDDAAIKANGGYGQVAPRLVSLPMQKFFNYGENPFTMNPDWSKVERVDDKLDGSLISTVMLPNGEYILKSKTSLSSQQAKDANRLLGSEKYWEVAKIIGTYVSMNCTVNMEYTAPDNQIVIGYSEPALRVLNVRDNVTGIYMDHELNFPEWFVCPRKEVPQADIEAFVESVKQMTGVEGYIFTFSDGLKIKLKTDWYSNLHLQKEQVTNPRRLFEAVLNETSDDLKGLFLEDPASIARIEEMEVKAKSLYNSLHKLVDSFYQANKELDRKSYAIKGQEELKKDGVFSLAMNLYLGRDMGLKDHLIKNYKSYGITDTTEVVTAE